MSAYRNVSVFVHFILTNGCTDSAYVHVCERGLCVCVCLPERLCVIRRVFAHVFKVSRPTQFIASFLTTSHKPPRLCHACVSLHRSFLFSGETAVEISEEV